MNENTYFTAYADADRYGMHPRDIFICYNGANTAEAERIIAHMEYAGLTCWYAERNIPPNHHDSTGATMQMLKKCSVFLQINSTSATNDKNIHMSSHAMALGIKRLQFKLDGRWPVDVLVQRLVQLRDDEANSPEEPEYEYEGVSAIKLLSPKPILFFLAILFGISGGVLVFNTVRDAISEHYEHRRLMAAYEAYGPAADAIERLPVLSNEAGTTVLPADFVPVAYLALQGDCEAQYELATMFTNRRDSAMALYWYRKAAQSGHPEAQNYMGARYYHGSGVRRDHTQAEHWYRQAALQGHTDAQVIMAYFYSLKEDIEQVVYWYRQAAAQGNAIAQNNLGIRYAMGSGGVPQSYEQAAYWLRKSAEQGHFNAMVNLGLMYEYGTGVEKDYEQAIYWYNIVQANPDGPEWLGNRLERLLARHMAAE